MRQLKVGDRVALKRYPHKKGTIVHIRASALFGRGPILVRWDGMPASALREFFPKCLVYLQEDTENQATLALLAR